MTTSKKINASIKELMRRGFKKCKSCEVIRPLLNFSVDKSKQNGYHSSCKICKAKLEEKRRTTEKYKKQIKEYKAKPENKRREKGNNLRRLFGLTLEQYDKMLIDQNNVCAICNKNNSADKRKNSLAVDHCHNTGKIRGLLCSNCNLGLGNMKDNIEILKKAIKYLEKNNV